MWALVLPSCPRASSVCDRDRASTRWRVGACFFSFGSGIGLRLASFRSRKPKSAAFRTVSAEGFSRSIHTFLTEPSHVHQSPHRTRNPARGFAGCRGGRRPLAGGRRRRAGRCGRGRPGQRRRGHRRIAGTRGAVRGGLGPSVSSPDAPGGTASVAPELIRAGAGTGGRRGRARWVRSGPKTGSAWASPGRTLRRRYDLDMRATGVIGRRRAGRPKPLGGGFRLGRIEADAACDEGYDDELDHDRCDDCKGSGWYVGFTERRHCPTCDGAGYV